MPVVTAGSKSLPSLDGYLCKRQGLCSGLPVPLFLLAIALAAAVFLCRRAVEQRLPKRLGFVSCAGTEITPTARTFCTRTITNLPSSPNYWVRLKQGQAHFEKQAKKLAVSRGEASGAAGGAGREQREMEEETRKSRSRGVSTTNKRDGADVSGGLSLPDQLLAPAERSGHVRASHVDDAAGMREDHQHRVDMDGARFGELADVSAGVAFEAAQGPALGQYSTPFSGHHMMDDENIFYGLGDASHARSSAEVWSSSARRSAPDFTRSLPPPPLTSPASAHGSKKQRKLVKAIDIPSRAPLSDSGVFYDLEDTTLSSSYPPTSPLLPPSPATTYKSFDPTMIMFPGPARDGGIRMVPVNRHGEGGSAHDDEEVSDSLAETASWQRHTRVYGGGVCLACVGADGEGGFYGDSVRPQDRRK